MSRDTFSAECQNEMCRGRQRNGGNGPGFLVEINNFSVNDYLSGRLKPFCVECRRLFDHGPCPKEPTSEALDREIDKLMNEKQIPVTVCEDAAKIIREDSDDITAFLARNPVEQIGMRIYLILKNEAYRLEKIAEALGPRQHERPGDAP